VVEFYRETEFEETEIGRIPKDWEVMRLGRIADIVHGFAFPLKFQGKKNGKYPFIKVSDMNLPGNEKYIVKAENTVDDEDLRQLRARIYPPGTIIFPKIGMVIRLNKKRILGVHATFDNNIMGVIPKGEDIDSEFLYYYFLGKIDLWRFAQTTTTPSIKKSTIERIYIPLPPLEEQKLIARILYSMDEAIRAVDASIAKYERLKKGLMQELLTKGIGHKEFKEEAGIGRIPASWKVVKLGDVAKNVMGGTPSTKVAEYWENGDIVWVTATDINDEDVYIFDSQKKITRLGLENSNAKLVPRGAVLMVTTASVGKLAIAGKELAINQQITALIPFADKILSEFLYYALRYHRKRYIRSGGRTTAIHINQRMVRNFRIPLPPLEEQRRIAKILLSVDTVIEEKKRKKARLERVKKALMDLLLTGKVRVRA